MGRASVFLIVIGTNLVSGCSNVDTSPPKTLEYDSIRLTCLNESELNYYYHGGHTGPVYKAPRICVNESNMNDSDTGIFDYVEDYVDTEGDPYPDWDDEIRTLCSATCLVKHDYNTGLTPVCEDNNWDGHEFTVFDAMEWDPSLGLNCITGVTDHPLILDPDASTIDWNEGVGSPLSIPLECSLETDCHDEFDADIDEWTLAFEIGAALDPIDPYTRRADYDCATGVAGAALALDMVSGSGAGQDDQHPLYGQAEYSAPDCGESTCPFYLAAFNASNTSHAWNIWVDVSPVVDEPKIVSGIFIEALQSSLVAWRPSTGQVAFPIDSLGLEVQFTVDSTCTGCTGLGDGEYNFRFMNDEVIYGSIDPYDGSLELVFTFPVPGGNATISMDMEIEGHPPQAEISLGDEPRCNAPGGYQLSVSDSSSTNVDNDINIMAWLVDGIPRSNGYTIAVGEHTIDLVVYDDRGAVSVAGEQAVEVIPAPACL